MSYGNPPPPPPPPGGGGYGAPPPGGGYGVPAAANHPRSTLILVLGILSIPCCGQFTGIPAIILGNKAKQEIAASGGAIGGSGAVNAGYICGIIGTVLSILGVILRLTVLNN